MSVSSAPVTDQRTHRARAVAGGAFAPIPPIVEDVCRFIAELVAIVGEQGARSRPDLGRRSGG